MNFQDFEDVDAIAIGSSAGGLQALTAVLGALPADFPAPVFVAHHRSPAPAQAMVRLLQRATSLRVEEARQHERPRPGHVYLSPGGRHLEIAGDGTLSVRRDGRVGFVCPSVDLLFKSVASRYGERCCAVVLTGTGRDGAHGVCAVRQAGGFVIAQDEATSAEFGMPCSAIETRKVDLVLPLRHIGYALGVLS